MKLERMLYNKLVQCCYLIERSVQNWPGHLRGATVSASFSKKKKLPSGLNNYNIYSAFSFCDKSPDACELVCTNTHIQTRVIRKIWDVFMETYFGLEGGCP